MPLPDLDYEDYINFINDNCPPDLTIDEFKTLLSFVGSGLCETLQDKANFSIDTIMYLIFSG